MARPKKSTYDSTWTFHTWKELQNRFKIQVIKHGGGVSIWTILNNLIRDWTEKMEKLEK